MKCVYHTTILQDLIRIATYWQNMNHENQISVYKLLFMKCLQSVKTSRLLTKCLHCELTKSVKTSKLLTNAYLWQNFPILCCIPMEPLEESFKRRNWNKTMSCKWACGPSMNSASVSRKMQNETLPNECTKTNWYAKSNDYNIASQHALRQWPANLACRSPLVHWTKQKIAVCRWQFLRAPS